MLISIVVATYNSAKTLGRCLDSIVPQLGNDCELLVIDGGSKDGTVDIINKYRNNIAYFVSEPDKGVYDAWNKAIVKARGKWITFIGSDDEMLPDVVKKYHMFFNENGEDYDIVSAKIHFVSEDGKRNKDVGEPFNWQKLVDRKLSLAHPGMLHNRRCFEKFGLFDIQYKICGDTDFLQRIGKNVKFAFMDEFLVNMAEGGLSDSIACLKEDVKIRYRNHTVSIIKLCHMYLNYYMRFKLGHLKRCIVEFLGK